MAKIKTAEQLIAIATEVLNNSNIVDEDLRQDVYLYVLSNDLCNEKSRVIKNRIKDFIIHKLIKVTKKEATNDSSRSYDQLALYSILADLLFNRLDKELAVAIVIKYGLDPAVSYDSNFTHKKVEELSAKGIKKLKAIANDIADAEA